MKRSSPPALVLLAAFAAACDGGSPTQREPEVARVFVTPAEQTINAGQTAQLQAQARDEDNVVVENTPFTWASLESNVATVSGTGLVTGLAGGTARIVAAAPNGRADTAMVTVSAPLAECAPGTGINLAVGQSATVQGAEAGLLCLPGAAAGAEYTVIPFYGTTSQGSTLQVRLAPSGVRAVAGPPTPSLAPVSGGSTLGAAAALAARGDGGFHTRLNTRARGYLSGLVPGARATFTARRSGPRMALQQAAPPAIGTVLSLNVGQEFCTAPDVRGGRVVAVSNRAVIVADTMNPAGGFTQADYDNIAATFDTLIYPVNTAAFGEPQDVDANGRAIIFYTRAVNELTPANVNYVVGGFFYGRDLFPRVAGNGFPACAGSNYAEMFYMLAPDPQGTVNGNARSTAYVRNSTLATVGHEFQHLISASRRLYVVPDVDGTDWSEEPWLNEGLSHIAEELLFYHRAQRGPRQNLGAEVIDNLPLRNAFLEFQDANYGRYGSWLENPEGDSPYDEAFGEVDDLATRGAAWGFLRYVADQRGGSDNELWYALVNSARVGLPNLQAVTGQDPVALVRSFAVAAYTDDAVAGVPAAFTHPSWNYRALYGRIDNSYPLEVRTLVTGTPVSMTMVAGGAAYLRAGVNANQLAAVQVTSAGANPPASLSVTVVRTK
ncbi:Ig-like domain-containing protein [Longimicrobium sp.]|uniref:Ig-like domain-containing protein n=1 Tax=Longimicrobium sp. TaxID=2029185 RepID=UPI002E33850D|nr:Ig-like domain-containing protein [Longimicrobium sp.]HEX6036573.1 Ig-like domain-containing protein [Longimicrobium sp.]